MVHQNNMQLIAIESEIHNPIITVNNPIIAATKDVAINKKEETYF